MLPIGSMQVSDANTTAPTHDQRPGSEWVAHGEELVGREEQQQRLRASEALAGVVRATGARARCRMTSVSDEVLKMGALHLQAVVQCPGSSPGCRCAPWPPGTVARCAAWRLYRSWSSARARWQTHRRASRDALGRRTRLGRAVVPRRLHARLLRHAGSMIPITTGSLLPYQHRERGRRRGHCCRRCWACSPTSPLLC
jgi:hypothetical protein